MTQQYPVGGPREPVYALMQELGFTMAKFSDKTWNDERGLTVQIYGAGSRARISCGLTDLGECDLAALKERLSQYA